MERDLAQNKQVMTAELTSEYKTQCDQIDGNIKAMLQKQAADAQVCTHYIPSQSPK